MDYNDVSADRLVQLCADPANREAWQEFVRRFHTLIALVVLRTAQWYGEFSRQTVDDLVQETYLKLCKDNFRLLRTFESRHQDAFYGFIKIVAANLVHDHFKARRLPSIQGAQVTQAPVTTDTHEHEILISEIDACLRSVGGPNTDRDRRVFWFYYRLGLSARSISSLPSVGLSEKGVESTLLRLTREVRERLSTEHRGRIENEGGGKGLTATKSLYY